MNSSHVFSSPRAINSSRINLPDSRSLTKRSLSANALNTAGFQCAFVMIFPPFSHARTRQKHAARGARAQFAYVHFCELYHKLASAAENFVAGADEERGSVERGTGKRSPDRLTQNCSAGDQTNDTQAASFAFSVVSWDAVHAVVS